MLSNDRLILKQLTEKDTVAFHALYFPKVEQQKEVAASNVDSRSPFEFVEQIVSRCNDILQKILSNEQWELCEFVHTCKTSQIYNG